MNRSTIDEQKKISKMYKKLQTAPSAEVAYKLAERLDERSAKLVLLTFLSVKQKVGGDL